MLQRNRILCSAAIFVLAYILLIVLWLQVKPSYGKIMIDLGARLAACSWGYSIDTLKCGHEACEVTVSRNFQLPDKRRRIPRRGNLTVALDSMNVPLTFGLIAGLYFYFRRSWRIVVGAAGILVLSHFLSVYMDSNLAFCMDKVHFLHKAPSQTLVYFFGFLRAMSFYLIFPYLVACYFLGGQAEHTEDRHTPLTD